MPTLLKSTEMVSLWICLCCRRKIQNIGPSLVQDRARPDLESPVGCSLSMVAGRPEVQTRDFLFLLSLTPADNGSALSEKWKNSAKDQGGPNLGISSSFELSFSRSRIMWHLFYLSRQDIIEPVLTIQWSEVKIHFPEGCSWSKKEFKPSCNVLWYNLLRRSHGKPISCIYTCM